jgi:hypothetical protein
MLPKVLEPCVLLLALSLNIVFLSQAGASDIVVRRFLPGTGQNTVGIVEASTDTDVEGPQALTTDENGDVYVLDQVNGRIIKFSPKNPSAEPQLLELPEQLQPTDLIVRKADIFVWDGSVHALQPSPPNDTTHYRGLEEVSTRAADDDTLASGFAQMGSVQPSDPSDLLNENTRAAVIAKQPLRPRQYIATRGAGSVIAEVHSRGDDGARIEVRRRGEADSTPLANLDIKVRDRLGAVEFLEIDHAGRMFLFAENIPNLARTAGAFVARYSSAGQLEGIYELPLLNVPLSRRFVTVSGEGDVYFLRTQSDGVDVLGLGFRLLAANKTVDVRTNGPAPSQSTEGPVTAVRPVTRHRAIETAFAFEGIQWTVNAGTYGPDPDTVCTGYGGRIRRPSYLHGKLGQVVRGIPYCWGCMGSFDQIRDKIERGVLAGNVCTRNEPRNDTAGVDCSAFVSACWGLASHFTTRAIPAITSPIDPSDLRPADAFNKAGSHVMLFLRFTADRMVEVIESSGACNGRVCRNTYPLSSLLARGYIPVRFRALASDTSAVAEVPEMEKAPSASKVHGRR